MSTTRIETYFERVDAHLATLAPADCADFLDRLIEQWTERYADFQRRVDGGGPVTGTTAFDYVETLAGLDQRAARVPTHA